MAFSGLGIRVVRAAVFTALCVTLSAGAHVLFSGKPLPLPVVTSVTAVVFVIALLLAGRERRFRHIAALLLPLQLGADAVFTTGQTACYSSAPPPVPVRLIGVDLICAGGDLGTPLARLVSGTDTAINPAAPWLLLAAHLCVGLLAAGWLRGGEQAVARLLRAAVAAGFRPLRLVAAVSVVGRRPAVIGPRPTPLPVR
ncbi:hypothetical protein, partial [Streptomyces otsuchiensis]|uniref:hypothetical protein n=1 Tax=Streptomyces otsuchiensis TaxID=2681388 RepID=UPI001031D892